uniref:Uncharacterized protein n=1 Tax=Utricularia reniformis TaxID=192314 RepID=A0A1Y0B3B0_9LAMI|nr:hypothetical protein AEK19_MT1693 [Utricularia reniformis]ART31874.1 hypothetical protein AEK19_MT1693 [Utricularia reniformis]
MVVGYLPGPPFSPSFYALLAYFLSFFYSDLYGEWKNPLLENPRKATF